MDDPIIDAICEKLRQKTYIERSKILYYGGLVEKMTFIVRGKMVSVGENGVQDQLSEGDVCGEELLTWCLEHSSVNKGKVSNIPRVLFDLQYSVSRVKMALSYQFAFCCCRCEEDQDSGKETAKQQNGGVCDKR